MQIRFAVFCRTPVLGVGLGVDFTFAWDNHNNNNNNHNNPHLNFVKGTVLGDKKQGIRDKGKDLSGVSHWRPSLVSKIVLKT